MLSPLASDPLSLLFQNEQQPLTLVQGISGRMGRKHSALMRAYGTRIVAGVAPASSRAADVPDIDGVPVFKNCAAAVSATGAVASVIIVPPFEVLPAIREAIEAGVRLVVSVTEGMPIADAVLARNLVRAAGARWIGASTPGIAIPGRLKLGFIPDVSLRRGTVGVMAKSGTLSYEVNYRLVDAGLGQSVWIGVGGDAVKGTRFADLLPHFMEDPQTREIVVIGEIGGTEEEELADALIHLRSKKPVYALIAGRSAREGVVMGHAGAVVHGGTGSIESKSRALQVANAQVFETIDALVRAVASSHPPQRSIFVSHLVNQL